MPNALFSYLASARDELKKVKWPSYPETVKKTALVIVISLIVAVYLGVLDYFLNVFLDLII